MSEGRFRVYESVGIVSRNEFYFIGELIEGDLQPDWFLTIPFNSSLGMTVRINKIEEVILSGGKDNLLLLSVFCSEEGVLDFLLSLNVASETLEISIEGSD